jgi:hypothetical protein
MGTYVYAQLTAGRDQDISYETTRAPEPATLVFVRRRSRRHHLAEEPINPLRESSGHVARDC